MRARAAFLCITLVASIARDAGAQTVIDTCGQEVPRRGVLAADLDCSADAGTGPTLRLRNGARLDLAGFTITSRPGDDPTIACKHGCSVVGPGSIIGAGGFVVGVDEGEQFGGSRIRLSDVSVSGGRIGLYAARVDLVNSVVSGAGEVGLWTGRAFVENSVVTGNGLDPDVGIQTGVFGQKSSRIINSTITGNGKSGVQGWHMKLFDSTVTDNHASPTCDESPYIPCADLIAEYSQPKLLNSTCETSLVFKSPFIGDWNVCSLD